MKTKGYLLLAMAVVFLFGLVFFIGHSAQPAARQPTVAALPLQPLSSEADAIAGGAIPPGAIKKMKVDQQTLDTAQQTAAFIAYRTRIEAVMQNDNPRLSAADFRQLMQETDRMQQGHYLMLSESFAIKEKLLRSQYGGAEL